MIHHAKVGIEIPKGGKHLLGGAPQSFSWRAMSDGAFAMLGKSLTRGSIAWFICSGGESTPGKPNFIDLLPAQADQKEIR